MEFYSCIRDECGEIVAWASDYTHAEIEWMLNEHPEWYLSCETYEEEY